MKPNPANPRPIDEIAADLVSLTLRAVEIGAFPGPAWRERAGELAKVVS